MNEYPWTQSFLDQMRTEGDPLADQVVDALFANHAADEANTLLRKLGTSREFSVDTLPPVLRDYFIQTAAIPALDEDKLLLGQQVFAEYGPEIALILACYSLPFCYADQKGVHVLYRTGFLMKRARARVFQTLQMLMDVFSPGGMSPGGKGIVSVQKVRLMHAGVRYLLTHDAKEPWDEARGRPVNQEDMALTYCTFTTLVIRHGLEKLGVKLSLEQQEAYLYTWNAVGQLLGLRSELRPATLDDADDLCRTIQERVFAETDEGRQLTASLIEALSSLLSPAFQKLPSVMMRHFLTPDPYSNKDLASMLGVPDEGGVVLRTAVTLISKICDHANNDSDLIRLINRDVSLSLFNGLLRMSHTDSASFEIPTDLYAYWKLESEAA
ncbi:oxygenase MpaB family protein [Melittangium boletus]|uniref:ER-bound oxygenase mpaB/mpaB'/Rubber oxygenase catalytic domain-containing protein n=1 Tax=Melittangium boletus DSM 14713 TaxID=1294270 RepID=A0A250INP7_9BACT|nr:oxygenase MpaB family protein [Melittangium boletus]ATB32898.1 hypothetical protein MEBOL_006387 [Melittangium boletus DSM 14713]